MPSLREVQRAFAAAALSLILLRFLARETNERAGLWLVLAAERQDVEAGHLEARPRHLLVGGVDGDLARGVEV